MNLIYSVFSLLLVLANVAGLTLLLSRWITSYALARATGLVAVVLGFFFVEHFVGFGKISWLWPLTTAASVYLIHRRRDQLQTSGFIQAEVVFLAAVGYGLFWRASFPNITPSSERITNLYFIQNYFDGDRLPPLDLWFPPLHFDFYYALQHYGAALMGRIFDLSAGMSYNLAFCVLMALPITLAWDFASRFLQERWKIILVVLTLAVGGTGATPFVSVIYDREPETPLYFEINDRTWGGARFVGGFDQKANTEIGKALFPPAANDLPEGDKPRVLPSENYGYQFALGDYHPPAGGFFLLLFAIALIGAIEAGALRRGNELRVLTALLGLSVPLQIATNTWVFPLQGMLVATWAIWRQLVARPPDWAALVGGGLLGGALLYPFLTGLAGQPSASAVSLVDAGDHTPWRQFLAALWPILLFIATALGIAITRRETRSLLVPLALGALGILLLSEFVFIDDPTGGIYQRTNSTMKWWGYLHTAVIAGLGTLLLASKSRVARSVVVASFLLLNVYAFDLYRYWSSTEKSDFGRLRGDGAYVRDEPTKEMLRYLEAAPEGIVLESIVCGAFCDSGIHALFAGKPVLLGWPMHVQTWRVKVSGMWVRKEEIERFYRGELSQPAQWLAANDVDYIVWTRRDAADTAAWQTLQNSIGTRYGWMEFGRENGAAIGLWVRSGAP